MKLGLATTTRRVPSPLVPDAVRAEDDIADGHPRSTDLRILAAAAAEFAEKGFGRARLDAIARVAGVPRTILDHRFGDKEGLRAALMRADT